MAKRVRRKFTEEFKAEAVRMVTERKYSAQEAAKNLGIHTSTLLYWIRRERRKSDAAKGAGERALHERVRELESRVRHAELERDILKKAAIYFAKEQP